MEYRYVRSDISSNCNLRCKFCVHDWKKKHRNINMSPDIFSDITPLIPLVQDEGFYFSCRFEPLINPYMLDLLAILPESCKNKVFLTTNLSLPLSGEFIEKLAKAPLHHINISITTFDPEIHKNLTRGGDFDTFIDNLKKVVRCFNKNPIYHHDFKR
jgi:molybdenum cofactor biosynthesis enzyme MoaA